MIDLVHLAHWTVAQCFDHLPSLKKLSKPLLDVIRYLESNSDSMPDYGERYRAGTRISTEFAESAGRRDCIKVGGGTLRVVLSGRRFPPRNESG